METPSGHGWSHPHTGHVRDRHRFGFLQKYVRQKMADGGSLLDCRHTGYFICFSAGIQALKP